MTTPLSITSRSQGQIYGAKPSLAEIERQLEADPMTRAAAHCAIVLTSLLAGLRRMQRLCRKTSRTWTHGPTSPDWLIDRTLDRNCISVAIDPKQTLAASQVVSATVAIGFWKQPPPSLKSGLAKNFN